MLWAFLGTQAVERRELHIGILQTSPVGIIFRFRDTWPQCHLMPLFPDTLAVRSRNCLWQPPKERAMGKAPCTSELPK